MDPNMQSPDRFDPNQHPGQQPAPPQPPMTPQQEEAHRQADRQARIDYLKSLTPPKKSRSWIKWVIVLLVVAGIAAAAIFFYLSKPDDSTGKGSKVSTGQPKTPVVVDVSDTPVQATEAFNSTLFGLVINHPKKWQAEEADGKLTITSAALALSDVAGKAITGQIVLSIGAKGQGLTAFDAGNGTAVLDSQKLTYKAPTSVQRAQTYLSFVQYAATATTGAIDALYVTGDYGYLKGQAIPKVDMQNLDPLITVSFLKCTDASCSTAAATSVSGSVWAKVAVSSAITSTIESLAINE